MGKRGYEVIAENYSVKFLAEKFLDIVKGDESNN